MATNNAIDAPLPISFANGGTGAALTASNGGILYSGASAGAILAGTATASQVLLSGSSTTPAWSTATYPATTTINQILYSSAANTVAGLATANNAILVTSGSGVPSLSTSLPAGLSPYILVDQTSSSVTMAVSTLYVIDNGASLVTLTLPTTSAVGAIMKIVGFSSGLWKVVYTTGQSVRVGSSASTATTGNIAATLASDCVELVCVVANTTWTTSAVQGNITVA